MSHTSPLAAAPPDRITAATAFHTPGPPPLIPTSGAPRPFLFSRGDVFSAPASPLEDVFDPPGAGDTFAGGFYGYIAKHGTTDDATLRQAVLYGSALASFCVEKFGPDRLIDLTMKEIEERVRAFRELSRVA